MCVSLSSLHSNEGAQVDACHVYTHKLAQIWLLKRASAEEIIGPSGEAGQWVKAAGKTDGAGGGGAGQREPQGGPNRH